MLLAAVVMSVAGQVAGCPPEAQPEWASASAVRKRDLVRACPPVERPLDAVDFASARSATLIREELAAVSASRWSWMPVALVALPAIGCLTPAFLGYQYDNKPPHEWKLVLLATGGVFLAITSVWALVVQSVNTHVDRREAALRNALSVAESVEAAGSGTAPRRPY